jgi:hypothetical protein
MEVSKKVLRIMQEEKISAAELRQMLDDAAYTSIRGCNRRYFQWLFEVNGNVLKDMQREDLVEIGRGDNRMLEEHEACHGEGCRECGWAGSVSRAVADATAEFLDKSLP